MSDIAPREVDAIEEPLLNEITRLRAENERLKADNKFLHERRGDLVIERDRAQAGKERLRNPPTRVRPPLVLPEDDPDD